MTATARRKHPSRAAQAPPVTLTGELTGLRFKNPDNGFFIGTLKGAEQDASTDTTDTAAGPALHTIKGESAAGIPRIGAHLSLTGAWVEDARWGRQFRFTALAETIPPSTDGMAAYLEQYTGGIGKKRSRAIVDRFGEQTFATIEQHPERLVGIAGITAAQARQIQASLQAATADREALATLHGWGLGPGGIARIREHYEGDLQAAVAALKINPYLLARHVDGFGFIRADAVALKSGVPLDSPFRLQAAILHTLEEAAQDGHTWLSRMKIVRGWKPGRDTAHGLLNLLSRVPADEEVGQALRALVMEGSLEAVALGYALPRLVAAEQTVAKMVRGLRGQQHNPMVIQDEHIAHLNAGQRHGAVLVSNGSGLLILTGGAGTGKTTALKAILDTAQANNLLAVLCAPTGKAAKRMTEATGRPASTIHRLLQWGPAGPNLNDLATDLLVVDEASMVDVELMAALLERVDPRRTRVLLVGDAHQLPPVGPGAPFRDIIAAAPEHVARLTEIMRTAADSVIPHNAGAVLAGDVESMRLAAGTQMFLHEVEDAQTAADVIAASLTPERLRTVHHVEPEDLQVLSPMKKGPLGTTALNEKLRDVLNPLAVMTYHQELEHFPDYRVGDRVIFTRNNYDAGYLNGDQGYVLGERKEQGKAAVLHVAVDGATVEVGKQDLGDVQLGYAITVHKSQGSEWPMVVVVCHTTHTIMLQRTLIYTAITRGKAKVVLVGTRKALGKAVAMVSAQERDTLLPGLLGEGDGEEEPQDREGAA